MRNIKLTIEYDGTNYCGWQVQNSYQLSAISYQKKSIQGTIEEALKKILSEKVWLVASGRTDSGVHAKGQIANFKTSSKISAGSIKCALNTKLPDDIVINKAEEAPSGFHSRFDARSKVYRYTISNKPYRPAINRQYVSYVPYRLDLSLIRKEAKNFLGKKNFKSFHASGRKVKDFVRHIKRINIKKSRGGLIHIDIEANGFLYNMARNIVGTLIEVGRGKMHPGSSRRIIKARSRKEAGPTAKACGLCLMEVKY